MSGRRQVAAALLAAGVWLGPALAAATDAGVIRLAPPKAPAPPTRSASSDSGDPLDDGRPRGFDDRRFERRLETLWFQRKAFLANGREGDAARQFERIRAFCAEEGVDRLDDLAGALLAEAGRYVDEGHYVKALQSIELAEKLDPGRPEVAIARATVSWKSGRGYLRAAGELIRGLERSVVRSAKNLTLGNDLAVALLVALLGCAGVFSTILLLRYQMPIRHEVEEWLAERRLERWSTPAGWGIVLLPFLLWFAAGWAALYWIVLTFRFARRSERMAAAGLLAATALIVPSYRVAVAVYGITTDPVVRNTLAAADGSYDPDRIVKLRQLLEAHPDDPVYHFLLGDMYANGRYFEEAYEAYSRAVALDPTLYQAHINVGNVFQLTGKHAEAVAYYRRALEVRPDSVLAWFNLHLAQSEAFHFKEAEQSLARAREIDSRATSAIVGRSRRDDGHEDVVDATVDLGSIWRAALEGRRPGRAPGPETGGTLAALLPQFVNPLSLAAVLALTLCFGIAVAGRGRQPARRCIRCGRAFCNACKSGREAHEYCSQCLHLFVIGDGLAPQTKTRKLYEVERHQRLTRYVRRFASLLLPGTAQLLRGRAVLGCLLLLAWLTSLVAWRPTWLAPVESFVGIDLRLDLLQAGAVPALFALQPAGVMALLAAVLVWAGGNLWRWREREA